MKRITEVIIVTAALLTATGCRPGQEKPPSGTYPTDLNVDVDNKQMTVSWKKVGTEAITGYNIYISDTPLADRYGNGNLPESIRPYNRVPFPGDTDPDDGIEHFLAEKLDNGKRYFVSVRVVFPDKTLSAPTDEKTVVCGARGEMELGNRYFVLPDGYSLASDQSTRADAVDNDLYFFSKDDVHYLCSPDRLNGFLRKTRFTKLIAKGDMNVAIAEVMKKHPSPDADRVAVEVGDWVFGVTADGYRVLLNVLGVSGVDREKKIRLFIAVSTLTDDILF